MNHVSMKASLVSALGEIMDTTESAWANRLNSVISAYLFCLLGKEGFPMDFGGIYLYDAIGGLTFSRRGVEAEESIREWPIFGANLTYALLSPRAA